MTEDKKATEQLPMQHSEGIAIIRDVIASSRRAKFDGKMWIVYVQPPPSVGKYPEQSVQLTVDQYNRYQAWLTGDDKIQKCLPDLTIRQREILITGFGNFNNEDGPPHRGEVIAFGERLWPPPALATYSYDHLVDAVWRFRHDNEVLLRNGESVDSRARLIRRDNQEAEDDCFGPLVAPCDQSPPSERIIFRLVDHLAQLMVKNPEGECQWPSETPVRKTVSEQIELLRAEVADLNDRIGYLREMETVEMWDVGGLLSGPPPPRAKQWLQTGYLSPNLSVSELENVKAQIVSAMQWHLNELNRRIAELKGD